MGSGKSYYRCLWSRSSGPDWEGLTALPNYVASCWPLGYEMLRICRCFATQGAFALVLFAGLAPTSRAAIIDDFSTPQGPLSGVPNVVSGPGILGDFRQASDPFFSVSGGVARFSFSTGVPGGTNIMGVSYDGTPAPSDGGTFAPFDLTDGGLATEFLLGISEVTGGAFVLIGVTDTDGSSNATIFREIVSPGLYTLPIPTDLVDFTRVNRVDLTLFLSPVPASVGIDFICTGTLEAGCTTAGPVTPVPEPESWGLLALLAAGLPWLARKRPAASFHESVRVR